MDVDERDGMALSLISAYRPETSAQRSGAVSSANLKLALELTLRRPSVS